MNHANFVVIEDTPERLTIRDLGPWDTFPTVTNDAEHVVKVLTASHELEPGQRLFYYDSDGHCDEILLTIIPGREGPRFAGFAPGRPKLGARLDWITHTHKRRGTLTAINNTTGYYYVTFDDDGEAEWVSPDECRPVPVAGR